MSSQLHLGFLKGLLVFLDLQKDQYCQKLAFNQFLYVSITYLPLVVYCGMSSDHAHHAYHVLRDLRDYDQEAHVCDFHAYDDYAHAHVYDCINHVYAGDDYVNLQIEANRANSYEKLYFLRFLPFPYLDV